MASSSAEDLFITPTSKQIPILLIDASGSTAAKFNGITVFGKFKELIQELPEDEFRLIFWNSENVTNGFTNGIFKPLHVAKKATIDQAFTYIKASINERCLTYPHLGFNAIPNEWISNIDQTKIYFLTDGQVGPYDKDKAQASLRDSINKLFQLHNKIQLIIITVEPRDINFNEMEKLTSAAGCDVYNVIMNNKLTKYVSKFISYTTNNLDGFVHINKNTPPVGFVPYGDKYFSELRVSEFIQYIINEILSIKTETNELLKIVQLLSSTICVLTKDKPFNVRNDIINTFCNLFSATSLDLMFMRFIISDAVNKENEGSANIFASYRDKLKNLYNQATDLLLTDVKGSIGIGEKFMTLPIAVASTITDGFKLVSGNYRMIEDNTVINNKVYPRSAVTLNGIVLPVLPYDNLTNCSPMNEQCLRQWVRSLISKMYGLNALEDIIIYVVLGIVLRVVVSDVPDTVKESYRRLGHVMLKKKRLNTDITELAKLEAGELPIPNSGKIDGFYRFMDTVNSQLNLTLNSMSLWYLMCLALNNPLLVKNQYVHCKEFLDKDFSGVHTDKLLTAVKGSITKVTFSEIPSELIYEYKCIITLDDIEKIGGYKFLPHTNLSGTICSPIYVLSDLGYESIMKTINPVCPICYTHLGTSSFEKVGPKPEMDTSSILEPGVTNVFDAKYVPSKMSSSMASSSYAASSSSSYAASSSSWSPSSSSNYPYKSTVTKLNPRTGICKLVIMKGVVGSGKTTFSLKLLEECEKLGKVCLVEGVDKYCRNGDSMQEATNKIKQSLLTINTIDNSKEVIVCIDTCGEHTTNKTKDIFDVDFTGWKKINVWINLDRFQIENYLAWSLRNVLSRMPSTGDSNYWLNPSGAGLSKCIDIHIKKARALFGKKTKSVVGFNNPSTVDAAIKLLNDRADSYAAYLVSSLPMDVEIQNVLKN